MPVSTKDRDDQPLLRQDLAHEAEARDSAQLVMGFVLGVAAALLVVAVLAAL